MTAIAAKVDALATKVEGMAISQPSHYYPPEPHTHTAEATEQVDYLGSQPRPQNNPYSNSYNPGWRNHPNFSWSNPQAQRGNGPATGFQRLPPFQEKKSNLEEMIEKFIQTSEQRQ